MTNAIEFHVNRFPNVTTFNDEPNPKNMTFVNQTHRPSLSLLSATIISSGTGCSAGLGTRYNVAWTPNQYVINGTHRVTLRVQGGIGTVNATGSSPATTTNLDVTTQEQNELSGNSINYTITWQLEEPSGRGVLQTGTFGPGGIYDILTSCAV